MMGFLANYVYAIPFICGWIFLIMSAVATIFPPKKINALYGYRTPGSMRSQERWDFAQKYSNRRMAEAGVLLILLSSVKLIFGDSPGAELGIGFGLLFGFTGYILFTTERAIKNKFR